MKAKTGSNTGYFDQFTINAVSFLPVELTAFTVSLKGLYAELLWNTATEVNNYGFEVERKLIDTWAKIGFVEGAGTTNAPKDYSFVDKDLNSGKYSYRLKQIDQDGKFEYSKEIEATVVARPKSFALEQNFPNPFNPTTTIQFSIPVQSNVHIVLLNMLGRVVQEITNKTYEAGNHRVTLNASTLPSGVYFYKMQNGSFTNMKKLLLLK